MAGVAIALPDRHGIRTFQEANTAGRVYATQAWVEHGTWSLAPIMCRTGPDHRIVDLSVRDGTPLLQKAPGLSWLGVPAYAPLYWLHGAHVPYHSAATWLALLCVWLPTLIVGWFLARAWIRGGASGGLAVVTLLVASPLAVYAATFQDYPLASMLLAAAWLGLRSGAPRHAAVGGLLAGVAGAVNYSFVIYGGLLGLVGLAAQWRLRPGRWLAAAAGGAALPLGAVLVYHAVVFGGPFTTAYAFMADAGQIALHRDIGFEWATVWRLLAGGKHGMLLHSPWAVAGLAGLVWMARQPEHRVTGWAGLVVVVANLGFASVWNTSNDDTLAFARHTLPSLPWLAWGLAHALGRLAGVGAFSARLAAGAIGGAVMVAAAYQVGVIWTYPYHPDLLAHPVWQLNLPMLSEGKHILPIWRSLGSPDEGPGGDAEWWGLAASALLMAAALGGALVGRAGLASARARVTTVLAAVVAAGLLVAWAVNDVPVTPEDRAWAEGLTPGDMPGLGAHDKARLRHLRIERQMLQSTAMDLVWSRRLKADLRWRDEPWPATERTPWCWHDSWTSAP